MNNINEYVENKIEEKRVSVYNENVIATAILAVVKTSFKVVYIGLLAVFEVLFAFIIYLRVSDYFKEKRDSKLLRKAIENNPEIAKSFTKGGELIHKLYVKANANYSKYLHPVRVNNKEIQFVGEDNKTVIELRAPIIEMDTKKVLQEVVGVSSYSEYLKKNNYDPEEYDTDESIEAPCTELTEFVSEFNNITKAINRELREQFKYAKVEFENAFNDGNEKNCDEEYPFYTIGANTRGGQNPVLFLCIKVNIDGSHQYDRKI